MTIILFHGLGSSKKLMNYIYDNKYIKNDFVKQLEKIDKVFIPEIPYTHIHYYDEFKIMKPMFKPINFLNYDDLLLDKYITNLYKSLDKTKYPAPYIVMGNSHGIYYACEFAKQFKNKVKYIISLDGSWITNKLNKKRLLTWKNKGKIISKINNQKELDEIIYKIKNEKNNTKYINMIESYIRGYHTKFVIKQKYEKLKTPFITFRDYNSNNDDNIMKEYNDNVIEENKILSKYDNHIIYVLLDASHMIWNNNNYKNTIINTIIMINKNH
jgi:hypothetical protein